LVQIVADVPRSFEAIVAKLLAKDPKLRYPSAAALRDDLRRFRNDEPVQALAAAQVNQRATGIAAAGAAGAAAAAAAATTVNPTTAPTGSVPTSAPRSTAVPSTGMIEAGYPTGASADAMYYDTNGSRTGWYALGAFVALILLVIGGVLLFQALSGDDGGEEAQQFVLEDYTNRPLAEVTADLTAKNIAFTTLAEENNLFPAGFVHRTDPIAGTLILQDQIVEVVYNPDPQLVPIPNVVGLSSADAQTRLAAEGFVVGELTTVERDDIAEDTVVSTDPPPETPALQGSTVNLVVSAPPSSVQVPGEVIGMTEIDARGILTAPPYEFVVTTDVRSSPTIPENTVIEIRPGPGELVEIGSDVLIIVSSGPEDVRVPVVRGRTEAQARNTLTELGLIPVVNYQDGNFGPAEDGRVISQSLPVGSLVPPGTEVTIVVARNTAPPTTTIPPTTTTIPPTTTTPPATTTTAPATTTTVP
jgi:serine/threonine-protein kinase